MRALLIGCFLGLSTSENDNYNNNCNSNSNNSNNRNNNNDSSTYNRKVNIKSNLLDISGTGFDWDFVYRAFCPEHIVAVFHFDLPNCNSYSLYPADTDLFRTSSRRLKKVTTSYDQTTRLHDVWQKTCDLRRLEDIRFITSWRCLFYSILKTSDLQRLEDIGFKSSWRCPIYNVLKTSDWWRLGDVLLTTF